MSHLNYLNLWSSLVILIRSALLIAATTIVHTATAEPFVDAGNVQVRHDIEYLADRRILNIPLTTWPMTWADVAYAVSSASFSDSTDVGAVDALNRLKRRVARETQWNHVQTHFSASASGNRTETRTFDNTPRSQTELQGSIEFAGRSVAGRLQLSLHSNPDDNSNLRLDGSYVGFVWSNYIFLAGAQDRWWGPGHAGSLILSSNSRPVPGIAIQRKTALPFKSRWLSWIGPWTAQLVAGQLESDRDIAGAHLLGARIAFKPRPSLEIGISRTAQWGGEGRPEDIDSLFNLIIGRDNRGDGIDISQEPGNQLAGFDWRYSSSIFKAPLTFYGQLIGEDEAGGFPSRYLGQLGLSTSLALPSIASSLRVNFEFSDTTCQFYESSKLYNCAYNHSIYTSGYRYRGRSIGHSTDNDSRQFALIATLNRVDRSSWVGSVRGGALNRGGAEDFANTLTTIRVDFLELDVKHKRPVFGGTADLGLGYRSLDDGESTSEARFFVKWSTRTF